MKDKFIFVSDVHYDTFASLTPTDSADMTTQRLTEIDTAFANVLRVGVKKSLPIVVGGDLFHRRNMRSDIVNTVVHNTLSFFDSEGANVIILSGNHDQANTSGVVTSLGVLNDVAMVVTTPTVYPLETGGILVLIPFMEHDRIKEEIEKLIESHTTLIAAKRAGTPIFLITHAGINGASLSGFERATRESMNLEDLHPEYFTHCFLGHYHTRQKLAANVEYSGALVQHSFKDVGQDRGYVIVSYEGNTTMREYVETGSPKFYKVTMEEYLRDELPKNCYVKVTDVTKVTDKLLSDSRVTIELHRDEIPDTDQAIPVGDGWSAIMSSYLNINCENRRRRRKLLAIGKELLYED